MIDAKSFAFYFLPYISTQPLQPLSLTLWATAGPGYIKMQKAWRLHQSPPFQKVYATK